MYDWVKRLHTAYAASNVESKQALADASGVPYDSVNKYFDGKVEKPRGNSIKKLAKTLRADPIWLETGIISEVRLVGKVGAGAAIDLLNNDDLNEMVPAPEGATEETIAVAVSGDSMYPAYEDGELLYYSANVEPTLRINRRCVVKLANGTIYVKILRPGSAPGFWNLESLNPAFPVMIDQVVEWVAKIDWTRPRD